MAQCFAYLITWAAYGTWLHGDERTSVDRRHNVPGTPRLPANASRELRAHNRLSQEPMYLTPEFRRVVTSAIQDHAAKRTWCVHAVNVRTNHAHVVVGAYPYPPEKVMKQFKEWGTAT